jgi:hypothetical protein
MKLNSSKKTILVLSDPHQEIDKLETILTKENYDIVVCLGDYFDSFHHNTPAHLEKTCNFLKKWVFKPNFFTCIGNHDIHYLYNNRYTICSGYAQSKGEAITAQLGNLLPEIREKFLWYIWIDDFLCSHAGINTYHMNPMIQLTKVGVTKWLDEQISFATPSLLNGGFHWLYGAGAARGGRQNIGGITWQDFDCEFEPIAEVPQIVGHTSHLRVLGHRACGSLDLTDGQDLCVDCRLNQYLIIHNKKITIKNYADL